MAKARARPTVIEGVIDDVCGAVLQVVLLDHDMNLIPGTRGLGQIDTGAMVNVVKASLVPPGMPTISTHKFGGVGQVPMDCPAHPISLQILHGDGFMVPSQWNGQVIPQNVLYAAPLGGPVVLLGRPFLAGFVMTYDGPGKKFTLTSTSIRER